MARVTAAHRAAPLTDGVLAWRLGATFLHLVIDDEDEPRPQATMRRLGGVFGRLFLRSGRPGPA
jgi:hypothetical protein